MKSRKEIQEEIDNLNAEIAEFAKLIEVLKQRSPNGNMGIYEMNIMRCISQIRILEKGLECKE